MTQFKLNRINLLSKETDVSRKPYWYLLSFSGILKFAAIMTTLIAVVAYYNFYYTTYDYVSYVLIGARKKHVIAESNSVLITGFYAYKFSTFAIILLTNLATVIDVLEIRERFNIKDFYYIECFLYAVSCLVSLFCGYLAIYTHLLFDKYKIFTDFTLIVAYVCSFIGAVLFITDFCRIYINEIIRNKLQD